MNNTEKLEQTIRALSDPESYKLVYHVPEHGVPMPSFEALREAVDLLRQVLFPGYFGQDGINPSNMNYYMGVAVGSLHKSLTEQIVRGLCFDCSQKKDKVCDNCQETATDLSARFLSTLPQIRVMLSKDVQAVYNGDPAAKSLGEVIYCYPAIRAIANYRIAHELYKLNVPLIPRIITELAHFETGIDIHPGATIGEYFAIDHGTGVVIGETSVIGNHVKIYQGVTLGAKSFPVDADGNPIKGIPRHPVVGDNVVIYAEATILGKVHIGKNSVIGGNMWITSDVPEDSKLTGIH